MYKYINKMLMESASDKNGVAKTPAAGNLFNTKLPEDKAQLFHHLVAKLLFLCMQTRQDIHTYIHTYILLLHFYVLVSKNQTKTITKS